eukprot:CAMPEP_0119120012 /NCGR_PEP_ID=MMETSP1310-20130426/1252_1 /TAXON_ID=464262 /ORGANISM="Genus nov. species nov., Strain RCC2339" /LENGTH=402 /DNA_ID=CAMNT_0007109475 /DNA_START=38 /DNA_END=1243 /DNA_ORIENTATION=-
MEMEVDEEEHFLALWGSEEEVEVCRLGNSSQLVSEKKKKEMVKRENQDSSSNSVADVADLSYEARRERNIKRNRELLESLSLPLLTPPRSPPRCRVRSTSGAKRKRDGEGIPRRKSIRLREKLPSQTLSRGVDTRMDTVNPLLSVAYDGRRKKLESDANLDLTLKDVYKSGSFGVETLKVLGDALASAEEAGDEMETPLDVAEEELGIHDGDYARLTTKRIFSLCCHPSPSLLVAAAGDAVGNVGIFQGNSRDDQWEEDDLSICNSVSTRAVKKHAEPDCAFTVLKIHSRLVRCVRFSSHSTLLSCSHDGLFRATDIERKKSLLCAHARDPGTRLTSFCSFRSADTSIVGNHHGSVHIVDRRTPNQKLSLSSSYKLHEETILCLDTFPANHMLASCCIDGIV